MANQHLFEFSNINSRIKCEICIKLTISRVAKLVILVVNLQIVIISWNFSWTLIRHVELEKCPGHFLRPSTPIHGMGMSHYGPQGCRVKIQTLSNMVILYTIWTEILFWTTFVRTIYCKNQPFWSYKPKCEGNWHTWRKILSSPLYLLIR